MSLSSRLRLSPPFPMMEPWKAEAIWAGELQELLHIGEQHLHDGPVAPPRQLLYGVLQLLPSLTLLLPSLLTSVTSLNSTLALVGLDSGQST